MKPSPQKKPKAILTGIDQIISDANSWLEFLTEIGVDLEKHRRIYDDLRSGRTTWTDAKYDLFDVLKDTNVRIHKDRFDRSIGNIELNGEAVETIIELKKRGYIIGIVSGSIDLIVETMARWLDIEDWYANTTLSFDSEGYWTDIEYRQDEAQLKVSQAKDFLNKHRLQPEEGLALGHSSSDIELFKLMPGITVNSKNDGLKAVAWESVSSLPKLLQVLQRYE